MASKIKGRIWDAYVACERLCESDRDADAWLRKAFEEARAEEQRHRQAGKRFTDGLAKYKLPVADAARFFTVKWFLDPRPVGCSFADACSLRPDALFALGARDSVLKNSGKSDKWHELYKAFADVTGLDYSEVFAA